MLTWIAPQGFKSFSPEAADITLGRFTLLVGANGSGKSNLLDLVRFFQGMATGLSTTEVLHGVRRSGREVWPGIRGHSSLYFGAEGGARLQIGATFNAVAYTAGLEMLGANRTVVEEWLGGGEPARNVVIENTAPEQEGAAYAATSAWEPVGKPIAVMGAQRSILLGGPLPSSLGAIAPDPAPLRTFLQSSQILDLSPSRMREYSPRGSTVLGAEGDGLSAVLRSLMESPSTKAELLDWLTELCSPKVRDLDFIVVEGTGDLLFRLHEEDGTTVTAQSVSDGTLRFLGLLAALWSVPERSLICLEEVEQGLHPARIDLLIELILQTCDRRHLQVIATTHSPRVLHALGQRAPDLLGGAVVFGRTPEIAGTATRCLRDLPSFEDVVKNRGVEHLFTSQWLERSL